MNRFIDSTGVSGFPHVLDLENAVWDRYEVRSQPWFVFINDDGSIETIGSLGADGLTERVEALIAA
jgi:hypothetical protein